MIISDAVYTRGIALFPIAAIAVLGVIAVGVILLIAALKSRHRKLLILLPLGIVAAVGLLLGSLLLVKTGTVRQQETVQLRLHDQELAAIHASREDYQIASQAQVLDYRGDTDAPIVTRPVGSETPDSVEIVSYSPSGAEPDLSLLELPEWVGRHDDFDRESASQEFVLSSYPKLSVEEADEELYSQLAVRAGDFLSAMHPEASGWYPSRESLEELPLIQEAITERYALDVAADQTVQMQRSHWKVELTPEIREQLFALWRPVMVQARLVQIGGGLGGLTLIFAIAAGILRFRRRPRGTARPTTAAVVATICFLAGLSILFLT